MPTCGGSRLAPVLLRASLILGVAGSAGFCEAPATGAEFEVASIKPTAAYDGRTLIQVFPGGALKISGATLKYLITLAYEVRSFQISGGPGWMNADHFDIVAKPDRSTGSENLSSDPRKITEAQRKTMNEQMRPRLRALLADRFQLSLHRVTQEEPVYALVVAKSGSKLQQSDGRAASGFRGLRVGRNQLTGSVATLEMLTTALANQLGHPVLDRTGLSGTFDFKLEWAPDAPDSPSSDGPSIFTALREQLGLTLESAKGPVEVLVIDRVEKPSAN
jgi:uncharacterized protein (TIGR03435 family)